MASHPVKGSHGSGPHNAGQATKVYDHRSDQKKVGEPSTKGNKVRGKRNGQLITGVE